MEINRHTDAWGQTVLTPEGMFEFLMRGGDPSLLLVEDSADIQQYNEQCRIRDKLDHRFTVYREPENTPEEEHAARSAEWLLAPKPPFDIVSYLYDKCETKEQQQRVIEELALYKARGLYPLLGTMVEMVDRWRANKIVWGVGRGSSVASYVLFLIGVHRIDSLKFGLDISDFLKPLDK